MSLREILSNLTAFSSTIPLRASITELESETECSSDGGTESDVCEGDLRGRGESEENTVRGGVLSAGMVSFTQ